MRDLEDAIERVRTKSSGRTRYSGMSPYDDEFLLEEIDRLRKSVNEPVAFVTAKEVGAILEAERQSKGESYRAVGERYSLSGEMVRLICQGIKPPSRRVLDKYGFEKVVAYRKKPVATTE